MRGQLRTAGKILELLSTGFALHFERTKAGRRALHKHADIVWNTIDRKILYQALQRYALQGLVKVIRQSNNREYLQMTHKGRMRVLKQHLDSLTIKRPKKWDRKWRVVIYDIPENRRMLRDALRRRLKELGFHEFQKSTFVYPYPCTDAINFIINFFNVEEYVYSMDADISPDLSLRKLFKIS